MGIIPGCSCRGCNEIDALSLARIKLKNKLFFKLKLFLSSGAPKWDLKEETEEFWRESARDEIQKRIEQTQNINMSKAKNTVLLIGDGMGITTMTAGRILIDGEDHMTQEDYPRLSKFHKIHVI